MGFDLYFINETKKQIVGSKKTHMSFEDKDALLAYLSFCNGDTIKIVGEDHSIVDQEVYGLGENKEYTYIPLHEFKINPDIDAPDNERLYRIVYEE